MLNPALNEKGGRDVTVKNEELFLKFGWALTDVAPSDTGRKQFFEQQSRGVVPENPDPYYVRLCHCKSAFDMQVSELKKSWGTDKWPGWCALWQDWRGEKDVLRKMLAWCNFVPEWVLSDEEPVWFPRRSLMPFDLSNLSETDRQQFDQESCSLVRDGILVYLSDKLLTESREVLEAYITSVVKREKSHALPTEHA